MKIVKILENSHETNLYQISLSPGLSNIKSLSV